MKKKAQANKKARKSAVESALLQSLQGALEYERGEKKLTTNERELPAPAPNFSSDEIRTLRQAIFAMTQVQFATVLNVQATTLRSWEQGTRKPEASALRLLQLLKEMPQLVKKIPQAS